MLRTEVIETGFQDEAMYTCLDKAIKVVRWTTNKSGVVQFIDVIHGVSLGYQAEDHSEAAQLQLRKQQAIAAEKARGCLRNRGPCGALSGAGAVADGPRRPHAGQPRRAGGAAQNARRVRGDRVS